MTLLNGDCLELLKTISDQSVDMVLADLPAKRVFTDEHRARISASCKGRKAWSKGKKMTRQCVLRNMLGHLKYDVTFDWLNQFEDLKKITYLNRSIAKKRDYDGFNTEIYKSFILKFYHDERFNRLYGEWIKTRDKWIKPSLDHIESKSNGGALNVLSNLQFISWLENRAKVNIPHSQWETMKQNMEYYL